jgi:hypothetical protein
MSPEKSLRSWLRIPLSMKNILGASVISRRFPSAKGLTSLMSQDDQDQ